MAPQDTLPLGIAGESPATRPSRGNGPLLAEVGGEYTEAERQRYALEVAPTRDEVLLTHGGSDLRLYERLLRDDQVHATFQQRRTAVIAMPLRVDPGGDRPIDREAADDLSAQLEALPWDRISYKMLSGLMYGYAIGECLFSSERARVVLSNIKVRKSRRFRFGLDGRVIMTTPRREEMPPQKFWVFTCGANDDDDLYGLGLGHWLYWPTWFKRNAHRFWSLWLEKLASGTPIAKASNITVEEENRLLGLLGAITNGGRIVIPKHVEIELLEAARDSGADYDAFMLRMDKAIAKVVLSQTMTTDDGSSLSQGEVHERVAQAVVRSDSGLLTESFGRGPATWLTEWNYPGAATPIVYRDSEPAEDLKTRVDQDKVLFDMGYAPRPEYIADTYGDGYRYVGPALPENVPIPPVQPPPTGVQ